VDSQCVDIENSTTCLPGIIAFWNVRECICNCIVFARDVLVVEKSLWTLPHAASITNVSTSLKLVISHPAL